jgi:hypothetical protein
LLCLSRSIRFCAVGLVAVVFFSVSVWADEWRLVPSGGVQQSYNDNVFFTVRDRERDYITTMWGGLAVQRHTERINFSLLGRGDQLLYAHNSRLNSLDQRYSTNIDFKMTPRLTVSARGLYGIDYQPDRDIGFSGLVLSPAKRYQQSHGASASYTISEKSLISLGYGYDKDDYSKVDTTDITSHSANLSLVHDLSETVEATKGVLAFGFSRHEFNDSRVDNSSLMVGVEKRASEVWSVSLNGGVRYTRSRIKALELVYPIGILETTQTDAAWGGVGRAALSYKGERTSSEISFTHDLMPASGRSGTVVRTSLLFTGQTRFVYELSGTLSAGYFRNKSDRGDLSTSTINEETLRVSPGFRYDFTPDIVLEGSYGFTRVKYKEDNSAARRNLLMLRLSAKHPFFE